MKKKQYVIPQATIVAVGSTGRLLADSLGVYGGGSGKQFSRRGSDVWEDDDLLN